MTNRRNPVTSVTRGFWERPGAPAMMAGIAAAVNVALVLVRLPEGAPAEGYSLTAPVIPET
jgi:hypothetical protein